MGGAWEIFLSRFWLGLSTLLPGMDRQFKHFAAEATVAALRIGGVLPVFANLSSELAEFAMPVSHV